MSHPAFKVVEDFENALAEYAGSKYCVTTESCTSALFLSMMYLNVKGSEITIPSRTYLSVPNYIIHAGATPVFEDIEWSGVYQLKPYPIYDGAKRFRKGMYRGGYHCLSFHIKKILNIGRGGCILTDNKDAVDWFKEARFDGRRPQPLYKETNLNVIGWNCYMEPSAAARGLLLLSMINDYNPDLAENPPYPDLSKFECYKRKTDA